MHIPALTLALTAMALPSVAVAAPTLTPPLAKALSGRTAGQPSDCITLATQARSSVIVDDTAIIYKESRRRWWVNFPQGGKCSILRPNRALVTVTPSTRLCRMDLVRVVDFRPAPFDYGSCALGDFTPYSR